MKTLNSSFTRLLAGVIGSGLEWYDFALYGCFASFIASHFFPTGNNTSALLGTFGLFAIGFLARPLGALVFGHYGDRIGRRLPLLISVFGISLPTLAIGILPSYAVIGWWAPALLLVSRLVQGFMVGGEYTGSLLFIAEDTPREKRATVASFAMISALGGMVCGTLVAMLLTSLVPAPTMSAWGWRAPFWATFVLSAGAFYYRRLVVESTVFLNMLQQRACEPSPIKHLFRHHAPTVLLAIGICALTGTTQYLLFTFLPSYIQQITQLPLARILQLNTLAMIFMLLLLWPLARLSDKVGRRPLLLAAAIGFFALSVPIFTCLTTANAWVILSGLLLFNTLLSLACAPMAALYLELFPTHIRYTGIALSYNLSFALFAGTAPLLASFSLKLFHSPIAPAALVMVCALISGACFYFMPETCRRELT